MQALATLAQLAPYVLLVELARLLFVGAGTDALIRLGWWAGLVFIAGALLTTGLMTWLHIVDARVSQDLRTRLLMTLGRVSLGFFDTRSAAHLVGHEVVRARV